MLKYWVKAIVAGLLLAMAAVVQAGSCNVISETVDMGTVGSLDLSKQRKGAYVPSGLSCQRDGNALIGNEWVRVKRESFSGNKLTNTVTGDVVGFRMYTSQNGTELSEGSDFSFSEFIWHGALGGASKFPLYYRTDVAEDSLPAGTYEASISMRWWWQVCTTTQLAQTCNSAWSRSNGLRGECIFWTCTGVFVWGPGELATIKLRLIVKNQCELQTPELNFGSAALVTEFSPVLNYVSVRCSKNVTYSVGLDEGNNADGLMRRLRNGNEYLAYELYKGGNSTERWGNQGTERRNSWDAEVNSGALNGSSFQMFTYRGKILPQQTPSAGTYTDSVLVDVLF